MKFFLGLNVAYMHKWMLSVMSIFFIVVVIAQPNTSIDVDSLKSKKYESRKLKAEKTTDSKFKFTNRIVQNTYTHYNYYFNANNRYNDIINNAKKSFKDDFTKLLPFYNYSLDVTANSKSDIDSILYKCNAGILLHDLRTDWVDDLYLLLGKTYLLKKDFDSAARVFQYINYIYAPKDGGYDIPLGSNSSNNNGEFTIASNEKRNLYKKITVKPTTRNESFIWQIRSMLEVNRLSDASSLISLLKIDPNFPERLKLDLYEMNAYLFYKQSLYDSAAQYLTKALPNATNKTEQARWEYLIGQLYAVSKKNTDAIKYFENASNHTFDPYLDVYARLNIVNLAAENNQSNAIESKLNELQKMAKRDKYENYRDIIYYAAGLLELKRVNNSAAIKNLKRSTETSIDNPLQKQKSFLLLGDVCFNTQQYKDAFRFYDSAKTTAAIDSSLAGSFNQKLLSLQKIVDNINTIHLQDSLQVLANLNEPERIAAVKKVLKQIRKEQGIKDEKDSDYGISGYNTAALDNTTIFNIATSKTSDFYFVNASLKAQGFRDFKIKWGNRPNVDNWRRQSSIINNNNFNTFNVSDVDVASNNSKADTGKAITFEGLLLNIPTTKERKEASNKSIIKALFTNGDIFQNQLEEYPAAIQCYQELLQRFPLSNFNEQALFNLYYCYSKNKQPLKADSVKNAINIIHPDGNLTYQLNNKNQDNITATKVYENIYNLFIEGQFAAAQLAKQKADNAYGKTFWTPQLLYIESIYYVKEKRDSIAIDRLQNLITQFPNSNLKAKAITMIDVLKRRHEIENYLTNLSIEKKEDATARNINLSEPTLVTNQPAPKKEIASKAAPTSNLTEKKIETTPIKNINNKVFEFNPVDAHFAIIVLNKVDEVFITETRNAFNRFNREKYYNQTLNIKNTKLNADITLVLIGPFANAADALTYVDAVKPLAKSRIISWLNADKYMFSIISNDNIEKVITLKEINQYQQFIKEIFPDKF